MPEREPVKIVEPGFAAKAVVAVIVSVLLLAGTARVGADLFAPAGGTGLAFRNRLISTAVQSAKNELSSIRSVVADFGAGLYRRAARAPEDLSTSETVASFSGIPAAQAAASENYRAEGSQVGSVDAKKVLPNAEAAAKFLTEQAADLAKDASSESGTGGATTDLSSFRPDAETTAQLGSLGSATHSFWKVAWQKAWPFIKQTAGWCWSRMKVATSYVLGAFKNDRTTSGNVGDATVDQPRSADATAASL